MAPRAFPFTGQDVAETDWTDLMAEMQVDGVTGEVGGTALEVYTTGTGTRATKVRVGTAVIRGHLYVLDAEVTLTHNANASGNARMDTVVIQLDETANTITIPTPLAGTTSGTLAPPALTRVAGGIWQIPLANVRVDPSVSVIASGKVTDRRKHTGLRVLRAANLSGDVFTTDLPRLGSIVYSRANDSAYLFTLAGYKLLPAYETAGPYDHAITTGFVAPSSLQSWRRQGTCTVAFDLLKGGSNVANVGPLVVGAVNVLLLPPRSVPFTLDVTTGATSRSITRGYIGTDASITLYDLTMNVGDRLVGHATYASLV